MGSNVEFIGFLLRSAVTDQGQSKLFDSLVRELNEGSRNQAPVKLKWIFF